MAEADDFEFGGPGPDDAPTTADALPETLPQQEFAGTSDYTGALQQQQPASSLAASWDESGGANASSVYEDGAAAADSAAAAAAAATTLDADVNADADGGMAEFNIVVEDDGDERITAPG